MKESKSEDLEDYKKIRTYILERIQHLKTMLATVEKQIKQFKDKK